jgi:hypothetical protein
VGESGNGDIVRFGHDPYRLVAYYMERQQQHVDRLVHAPEAEATENVSGWPDLEAEDIREALRYAAETVRERELPLVSAR